MKYFITFLLGTMPFLSHASDYNAYIDGIYYILKGSNAIVTSGETKYEGEILIPDRIEYEGEEYEVKSISNNAFYQCRNLRVVSIPSTVSTIGDNAFSGYYALGDVTISNGYCSHFCAASIICIRSLLRHALGINLSSYLLFQDILAFFTTKPRHVITTRRGFNAYRSLNVFVKPNDQSRTCLSFGMARKRRQSQQIITLFV